MDDYDDLGAAVDQVFEGDLVVGPRPDGTSP